MKTSSWIILIFILINIAFILVSSLKTNQAYNLSKQPAQELFDKIDKATIRVVKIIVDDKALQDTALINKSIVIYARSVEWDEGKSIKQHLNLYDNVANASIEGDTLIIDKFKSPIYLELPDLVTTVIKYGDKTMIREYGAKLVPDNIQ